VPANDVSTSSRLSDTCVITASLVKQQHPFWSQASSIFHFPAQFGFARPVWNIRRFDGPFDVDAVVVDVVDALDAVVVVDVVDGVDALDAVVVVDVVDGVDALDAVVVVVDVVDGVDALDAVVVVVVDGVDGFGVVVVVDGGGVATRRPLALHHGSIKLTLEIQLLFSLN